MRRSAMAIVLTLSSMAVAAEVVADLRQLGYRQLPQEVRAHIEAVRSACKEYNADFSTYDDLQGVEVVDLDGDGSQDILIDNEGLCGDHLAGANCSNRGCDLLIWKQIDRRSWRKIFEEHLHRKFISIERDANRFQMIAASIYAGDPRCEPAPDREYTSGQSCDLLIYFRNGKWEWWPVASGGRVVGDQGRTVRGSDIGFQTPSGNIHCKLSVESAPRGIEPPFLRCDIGQIETPIPRRPKDCEGDWGTAFGISRAARMGARICVGDTTFDETHEVLAYGRRWEWEGFTCLSEQSGLTCSNGGRHGFSLSRRVQKLF